jgi:hypothetical protein
MQDVKLTPTDQLDTVHLLSAWSSHAHATLPLGHEMTSPLTPALTHLIHCDPIATVTVVTRPKISCCSCGIVAALWSRYQLLLYSSMLLLLLLQVCVWQAEAGPEVVYSPR